MAAATSPLLSAAPTAPTATWACQSISFFGSTPAWLSGSPKMKRQAGAAATFCPRRSARLRYGEPAATRAGGLALLESPGNDGVSSTALVASGATVLLFTTGRGTPLGFPVPTLKISSNTAIAEKKPHWIDLNAGAFLDGTATMDQLADELFALILDVASGRKLANNEKHGYREIAIWKDGVTL